MSHTTVNYHDVNAVSDAIHFLRDPLECERLGISVIDCEPGWTGRKHDHGDENHEEVYVLIEGEATITIDGETVSMTAGDAIRIDPDASRQIRNGDTESTFVVAGAP